MSDTEILIGNIKIKVLDSECYVENANANSECYEFSRKIIGELDKIKAFTANTLLELYNDTWFTDEIGILTIHTFIKRISLSSVKIFDEQGAAAIYLFDGDIFGGHYIEVGYNNGEISHCGIIG